jgi:hypothetical protein
MLKIVGNLCFILSDIQSFGTRVQMLNIIIGKKCHDLRLVEINNATWWTILDVMRLMPDFPKVMQYFFKMRPYQSCYLVSS